MYDLDCVMGVVSENEFAQKIKCLLKDVNADWVTGPGRSGAVAAVYASHILRIPFIPFGSRAPSGKLLIIDTATESGKTLRKAARKYFNNETIILSVYNEPPRVAFWYEALKPQRYKHENNIIQ